MAAQFREIGLGRDQRGAVALMMALMLPVLLAMAGLAVDVGIWYREQVRLQIGADAASIAAAYLLTDTQATQQDFATVAAAAVQDATAGVLIGTLQDGPQIAVASDRSSVTVTLTSQADRYFSMLLPLGAIDFSASASAGFRLTQACILALGRGNSSGITINGNARISAPGCSLFSDAAGSQSVLVNGNAKVQAQHVGAVGDVLENGNVSISPTPASGQAPIGDPLPRLQAPPTGACQAQNSFNGNGTVTLSPGTYCGGLSVNGNYTLNFQPGVYVITNGNLQLNGNVTVASASGVTFYLGGSHPGAVQWNGNTAANTVISAPTSGPYAGILIYQDRGASSGSSNIINGNAGLSLSGTLYFPSGNLTVNGNAWVGAPATPSAGVGINIVAQSVLVNGNFTLRDGFPSPIGASGVGTPIVLLQ